MFTPIDIDATPEQLGGKLLIQAQMVSATLTLQLTKGCYSMKRCSILLELKNLFLGLNN